ncbi:MAG TPA: hypothetical protein VEK08_04615 [Planctomycetota bacterium]|nr:hypothetical protein [Planctomycetota bacterium]
MEVNKLESKEVLIMLFGLPVMVTIIVLASIGVGHWVTTRSDRPTNVHVAAASPKVEVNVPQAPAPQVNVSSVPPNVDVKVPPAPPPTINVTTPPPVVTVVNRTEERAEARPAAKPAAKPEAKPAVAEPAPPTTAPALIPVKAEPAKNDPQPIKASYAPETSNPVQPTIWKDEDLTLDTLYKYAEKYIESYCQKRNLDPVAENKKWLNKWQQNVEQAIKDNTDQDEQSYINRIAITKRECFDIEKATPEKIVEGCRIMLRYRDGQFAWLQAMKDAVTSENMKKTLVFLAAGVQ